MKKAIGYMRVSTSRQGEEGIGLEVQEHTLLTYAELSGYRFLSIERDIQTGKGSDGLNKRKGLKKAIELAKEHGCPVVVVSLDRLARNVDTVEQIVRREGVVVISCVMGEGEPVTIMVEAAKAEKQGELISQRTKQALDALKKEGVKLGNRKNLPEAQAKAHASNISRADEQAQRLAPILDELAADGITSIRKIAESLNARGIQTDLNRPWKPSTVANLKKRIEGMKARSGVSTQHANPNWGSW